ncbi:antitoxin [Nocardia sp. GTS18]|uniref:antitoxin n=1 Tax=Nocardia sp. GTS18 TaxID=1778064 RepID=UPI0015EF1DB0|nr:antitoxin [Nocardia sp. GTS18]
MRRQITVRLDDATVSYLDRTVSAGLAPSRAAVIEQALERDRLRRAAERDAEILAGLRAEADKDMNALATYAAGVGMDD